jgi:hypothetical protein
MNERLFSGIGWASLNDRLWVFLAVSVRNLDRWVKSTPGARAAAPS